MLCVNINCGATLRDGAKFCTSCGTKVPDAGVEPTPPPPDYNRELSELHQRVVQDELGFVATIDELGWVQFKVPRLGECKIILREYHPEFMEFCCVFFQGKTQRPQEDFLRICNLVNQTEFAKLDVRGDDTFCTARASIALLLPVPDEEFAYQRLPDEGFLPYSFKWLPDEGFIRAVISRAMTEIETATTAFANELQKLSSAPTA